MRIVINATFGGFGLSHKGVMYYARLCGFELYPFVDVRDSSGRLNLKKFKPYEDEDDAFLIHYSKEPLNDDGTYIDGSYFSGSEIKRNDSNLIKTIEDLGDESWGWAAKLKIVEIPDDIEWQIEEYDGSEWIAEKHRTWN